MNDPMDVAVARLKVASYSSAAPFHPDQRFPEYRFGELGSTNLVYAGVRKLFQSLGMDVDNHGTPQWNPLGAVIKPGDRVLVKPNLIWHRHRLHENQWQQVITHGSLVRCVIDYVLIALHNQGEIWVADGPQQDAHWDAIVQQTGLATVCRFYKDVTKVKVALIDLREEYMESRDGVIFRRTPLTGDPLGSVVINLDAHSRFNGFKGEGRYYGADYDQTEVNAHHRNGCHGYRLSGSAAVADVIINLPKMKTHKKTGVTLCLKNLVGVNTARNWLPHYTDGSPDTHGDQFATSTLKSRTERRIVRLLQQLALRRPLVFAPMFRMLKQISQPVYGDTESVVRSGNWYGNDTAWRMVHDINRAALFSAGKKFPTPCAKRYLAVVDGVIAGEGNGPEAPDAVHSGLLVGGLNPVAVDCATTVLMGLDPLKIPLLREAFKPSQLPLVAFSYDDIRLISDAPEWNGAIGSISPETCLRFKPHFGWRGKVERKG